MDVILLERIEKLGQMGDVVSVKPGFARNWLLPQKKAMRATEANKKVFEGQKAQLETENLKLRDEAEGVAGKMDDVSVIMVRQAGEAGQLYGSVNTRDISEGVTSAGFTVTRQQIELAEPIKAIGLFQVQVRLHPEVAISVTVNVARSVGEAEIQAQTGEALIQTDDEDDEDQTFEVAAEEASAEDGAAEEGSDEEGSDDAAAEDAVEDADDETEKAE